MNTINICSAVLFALGIVLSATFLPVYLAGTFSIWGLVAPLVLPFIAGFLFLATKRRAKIERETEIGGTSDDETVRTRQQRSIEDFAQMH